MRIASSVVVALAASISAAGCSPFQGDRNQVDSSFRQAPTSELMAMAERYERQGEYAHAARLYEELLKGDPTRTQVRDRLHALASYGVVSPHVQEALVENVEHIVADHQRQREEVEAQDNVERFLADMPSAPTTPGYTLVDAAAGVDQWAIPQSQPAPQTSITAARQSAPAVAAPTSTPTTRSEVPQAWHRTVIRPQESPLEHTEAPATVEHRPLTHVVSTGSNLWRTAAVPATVESNAAEDSSDETIKEFSEWTHSNAGKEASTAGAADDSWWTPRSTFVSAEADAIEGEDSFCDPIITGTREAAESPDTEAASTTPLQQAQAAYTLWQLSGDAAQCVPTLISLLESADSQVVEVSCYLIGEIGPSAQIASAALQTVRDRSEHEASSILAAEALAKIDPASDASVQRLVEATRSTDHQSRMLAAITLASVDHAHEEAVVPALARMLDDESAEVRSAAALSLGGWGEAALPHTSKLEELALTDSTEVSEAARISLECLSR